MHRNVLDIEAESMSRLQELKFKLAGNVADEGRGLWLAVGIVVFLAAISIFSSSTVFNFFNPFGLSVVPAASFVMMAL